MSRPLVPPVPFAIRISIGIVLMLVATGLAMSANWLVPEMKP